MARWKIGQEGTLVAHIAAICLEDYSREGVITTLAPGTPVRVSEDAGIVSGHQENCQYYGIVSDGRHYRVDVGVLDAKLAPKGE